MVMVASYGSVVGLRWSLYFVLFLALHPAFAIVDFYGCPKKTGKKACKELIDSSIKKFPATFCKWNAFGNKTCTPNPDPHGCYDLKKSKCKKASKHGVCKKLSGKAKPEGNKICVPLPASSPSPCPNPDCPASCLGRNGNIKKNKCSECACAVCGVDLFVKCDLEEGFFESCGGDANKPKYATAVAFEKMSTSDIRAVMAEKQGMNANKNVPPLVIERFTGLSSWFWTYSLTPNNSSLKWGLEHSKEFVPLLNLKDPISNTECLFQEDTCTTEMIVKELKKTLDTGIAVNYLMGFNEPYGHITGTVEEDGVKALKGVTGEMGAEWWRKVIQPAAVELGLKLVSPTTGISSQKARWIVEFLAACYDKKDEADFPCDVEMIEAFSVHEYKCSAGYWRKYLAVDGGEDVAVANSTCLTEQFKPSLEENFYSSLKRQLQEHYGAAHDHCFWEHYINDIKLWITEMSCSGDPKYDKITKGSDLQTPDQVTGCSRITGQSCQYKEGSVGAILSMSNIERFSWFSLYTCPRSDHPNYESIMEGRMTDCVTNEPTPVGRALLNALDFDDSGQCAPNSMLSPSPSPSPSGCSIYKKKSFCKPIEGCVWSSDAKECVAEQR